MAENTELLADIEKSLHHLRHTIAAHGTIYACGNGGSTCDAMHLTEELVARYKRERPGIRAMHFADPSILTCWSNDYSYETAFARQAETFCRKDDILVAISTSGNSKNVVAAAQTARSRGAVVIALTGQNGGELKKIADVCLCVPAAETERIQEGHITLIHLWLELLETEA